MFEDFIHIRQAKRSFKWKWKIVVGALHLKRG